MPKIVISYRRSFYDATAGRIRDKLVSHYGDDAVYMDIDNIPFGIDFRDHINNALHEVDVLIAIIGPKWVGPIKGRKARIFDETDPVRVEIETALKRQIPVVPILVDGVKMPKPEELPESISKLAFHNAAIVDAGRDFHQHMERMFRSMDIGFQRAPAPATKASGRGLIRVALGAATAIAVLTAIAVNYDQLTQRFTGRPFAETRAVEATLSKSAERNLGPDATRPTTRIDAPRLERRVALVIGNSDYSGVPRLKNPVSDARAISSLFQSLGFSVINRNNVSNVEFRSALREFQNEAADADIAAIYYSGHAMEVSGENYLIPTDAKLETEADVGLGTVPLQLLFSVAQRTRYLNLILLDACRDNPFVTALRQKAGTRSVALEVRSSEGIVEPLTRSVGRGLARVEPAGNNFLVGYAAKAGSVAMDGEGNNSPYASALVKHLGTPGLDIRIALGRVRDEVLKATRGQQEPFVYGSVGGDSFVLAPIN